MLFEYCIFFFIIFISMLVWLDSNQIFNISIYTISSLLITVLFQQFLIGSFDHIINEVYNPVVLSFYNINLSFFIALLVTMGLFFCLLLSRPQTIVNQSVWYVVALLIVSLVFIFSHSIIILFISFECLLLLALGLLKLTSKSERIGEAISEMFMWTLFGSIFLLLGFFTLFFNGGLFTNSLVVISNINALFFVIGFGVKIPIWPFISWLLKAHVEASVEFSILLSGFIVKLGILGLWRILELINSDWIINLIIASSTMAILDATSRLFSQVDLKRIVALTTVIEMNWLNICYLLGDVNSYFLAHFLIVAHCFTTSSEFLLVEFISKRYSVRNIWHISGIWYKTPVLWYFSVLVVFITVGFPGTSIFIAKFIFLSTLLSYSLSLFVFFIIIFLLVLPLFFIRLWVPLWFGLSDNKCSSVTFDLTAKEILLLSITSLTGILLGLWPSFFFSVL